MLVLLVGLSLIVGLWSLRTKDATRRFFVQGLALAFLGGALHRSLAGILALGSGFVLAAYAVADTWRRLVTVRSVLNESRFAWIGELARGYPLDLQLRPRLRFAAALVGVVLVLGFVLGITTAQGLGVFVGVSSCALIGLYILGTVVDVEVVERSGRLIVTALALAVIDLALWVLARELTHSIVVDVAFVIASITLGLFVPSVARTLRPARGVWLDRMESSHHAVLRAQLPEAIRFALEALSGVGQNAMLVTFAPGKEFRVDSAGYLRERGYEAPAELAAYAATEPFGCVRREWLQANEVRRPDLRAHLMWMRDLDAHVATLLVGSGEPVGFLLLSGKEPREPWTVEELRALQRLCEALSGVVEARLLEARLLAERQRWILRANDLEDSLERVEHARDREAKRHELWTERMAYAAAAGMYGTSVRFAYQALERRCASGGVIVVEAPSGADVLPYMARAHLSGQRAKGPFVVVDGTATREHDVERWCDPTRSPLALANQGMLVLEHVFALPAEIQSLLAAALLERRLPWEDAAQLDVQLALVVFGSFDQWMNHAEPLFVRRLGELKETCVSWPSLHDRPEDLRSLVAEQLARAGLRRSGRPLGIDAGAIERLYAHPFVDNELELRWLVHRLSCTAAGEVITRADVLELLGPEPELVVAVPHKPTLRPVK